MKIEINREVVLPPLQAANSVVERRQNLPILANVLLSVEREHLTLTATDMEVETVTTVPCEASAAGSFTLPARKFLDIVRALPAEAHLELTVIDERVRIRSGRSRFTLGTLPASDFPNIGELENGLAVRLETAALGRLIELTHFAMAHHDVRYYLNGLLLELAPGRVRAVATDGHRLALSDLPAQTGVDTPRQVIVPRKGVSELLRLLEGGAAEVDLLVSENHLQARVPAQHLTTKLIDGKFPDYERVLPKGGDKHLVAEREILRQVLSRTSILSNEKFRGIRLGLRPGLLTAQAHNPEQEEAEEEMEVEYDGAELEIGFNAGYLLDVLNTVKADTVRVELSDPGASCLITPAGDEHTKYVVMPMRL